MESLKETAAKGLFWGGLSNAIQQVLNLVFGIFVARLLNVEEYGIVGMLAVFSVLGQYLMEGGFKFALCNKKNATPEDFNSVFWINVIIAIIIYAILFVCAPLIAQFFHTPELKALSRLTFLSFVFSALGLSHNAYLYKNLMAKQMAKCGFVAVLISGLTGLTMALAGMSYWGIATQNVCYVFIFSAMTWHYSPIRPHWGFSIKPIKEMLPFSIKIVITNLFHFTGENIFSLLLGRYYTPHDVGQYSQAYKWNNIAQMSIVMAINNISQPLFVKANQDDRRLRVFRKLLRFTVFVSMPAMIGLSFAAPEFITITITDKWLNCANIMRILCIWGAFYPVYEIYNRQLVSSGKSGEYMYVTIVRSITQIIVLAITHSYGLIAMAYNYLIINLLSIAALHFLVSKINGITIKNAIADIAPYLTTTLFAITLAYIATYNINNVYLRFTTKVLVTAATYIITLKLLGSVMLKDTIDFLKKLLKHKQK